MNIDENNRCEIKGYTGSNFNIRYQRKLKSNSKLSPESQEGWSIAAWSFPQFLHCFDDISMSDR